MPAWPTLQDGSPDLDSLWEVKAFAAWQGKAERWVRKRLGTLPGVISESRQHVRIHPRTYLAKRLKK